MTQGESLIVDSAGAFSNSSGALAICLVRNQIKLRHRMNMVAQKEFHVFVDSEDACGVLDTPVIGEVFVNLTNMLYPSLPYS